MIDQKLISEEKVWYPYNSGESSNHDPDFDLASIFAVDVLLVTWVGLGTDGSLDKSIIILLRSSILNSIEWVIYKNTR